MKPLRFRCWSLCLAGLLGTPLAAQITPGATPEENHARLTAALSAAATTGGVITLAPGEYPLTKTLMVRNVTLTGPGATLRFSNPEGSTTYLFGLEIGAQVVLRDLAVVGEGPRCVPLNLSGNAREVQLRQVTVTGGTVLFNGNAPNSGDLLIEGCRFVGGGYGVLLNENSSGENVRIIGCHFVENKSDAIELNFPKKGEGKFIRNVVINGNIFDRTGGDPNSPSAGFGVGIAAGHNIQITGNTFYKCAVQGVHIEDDTDNVTISGNNFEECGLGNTTKNWTGGVHLLNGTKYVTISANNFSRCRYGVSGLQGYKLHHVSVVGNTFRDNERGAWFMQFPQGVFQGNVLENCGIALELWRSPQWVVTGNLITAPAATAGQPAPEPRVGIRCLGFRELVCTGNILAVDIPFDHDNRDWYDQHYLVKDNVIIRGRSLRNGAPADKHPGS